MAKIEKARSRALAQLLASASIAAITMMGWGGTANALVTNDTVSADDAVDTTNEWAGVGMMWNREYNPVTGTVSTYVCTGTLINPRTVILAQHCTGQFSETYDPGAGNHMGFSFNPTDAFTGFDNWRRDENGAINNPFTGVWESDPDGLFYNVIQVQSPYNNTEFFPGADVMMATLDTPAIGLPTYGVLLSPLTGPTHATLTGYGLHGSGTDGPNEAEGIDYKRRIGENMIDGLFSQADFLSGVFAVPNIDFGVEGSQLLYHIDFDRPDRDPNNCDRGEYFGLGYGNDIVCFTGPYGDGQPITWDFTSAIYTDDQIDWYPGDALPGEAGTAGGDSGSGLFADEIYERPLVTGVLSGGWVEGIFDPAGGYGSTSYYNPLFLFRDWLVQNNPYVYASARNGNGNWSDARHWVQNMDPNYFYIDAWGRVRSGLPSGAEPGYYADEPKWGTVFDLDIPGDIEGATSPEAPPVAPAGAGVESTNFVGIYDDAEHWGGGGASGGSSTTGNTASRGAATGPGSTRFVPNNDYGTYGSWDGSEDGTAQFFDVTLNNFGRTRLDMNVEIDNLTVAGPLSELDVRAPYELISLVAVDQFRGFVNIDGTVTTREYMLWGGFLTGNGVINAPSVYNVDGVISAGDLTSVGSMTINGDYIQSSHGDMVVNVSRRGNALSNDFIQVNGDASLDGGVFVVPVNIQSLPRYNDVYRVLHADTVIGNFDDVDLLTIGPALYGESIVRANGNVDIVVKARRLGGYFPPGHHLHSFGQALDSLRWGGHYAAFEDLFSVVDTASWGAFDRTLFSLTPVDSFQALPMSIQYTQQFSQGLDLRTAELRAGVRGMSARSAFTGERIARAGLNGEQSNGFSDSAVRPFAENERLGFFISGQGNLTAIGNEAYEGDRYNPASLTAFSEANMTVGADYRVSDGFALGVATTFSRYISRATDSGFTPMDHSGYGVMAYATAWQGPWYVDSYVGVARHDYETARIPGANLGDELDSAYGAVQSLAGVRGGYNFEPLDGLTVGPTLGLSYSNLSLDGYTEYGGDAFALDVAGRSVRSLTVESSLQFNYQPVTDGVAGPFSAFGSVSYVTELGDDTDVVNARFVNARDVAFQIDQNLDREWLSATAGFAYSFGPNFSTNLQAATDMGRGDLSNTSVQAGFNWRF